MRNLFLHVWKPIKSGASEHISERPARIDRCDYQLQHHIDECFEEPTLQSAVRDSFSVVHAMMRAFVVHLSMVSATYRRFNSGGFDHCEYDHAYGGFDIGCGQQQMALRIDQFLTPNFDLINQCQIPHMSRIFFF